MFAPVPQHRSPALHASAYRQVGVETRVDGASPHQLVAMLFDGFMDALAAGPRRARSGNIEAKGRAIGRAVRIVDEGLKAGLNLAAAARWPATSTTCTPTSRCA